MKTKVLGAFLAMLMLGTAAMFTFGTSQAASYDVNFGSVNIGANPTQPVTLSFNYVQGYIVNSVSISGSGDFSQTNDCISLTSKPNGKNGASSSYSCTANVKFSPSAPAGLKTATLTLSYTDIGNCPNIPAPVCSTTFTITKSVGGMAVALEEKPKEQPKSAKIIPVLEVDPYSDVNPSSETKITYSFRVTNEGEGKATNLHFVLPYGEFLTIADFTDKSSDKEWVSKVDAVNSNVTVELPDLDKDATVSGKLVFNPKKGKSIPDGTKVETSYVLIYQDPANAAITINSNLATLVFKAVYGKLEVDNENNKFRFTSNNLLKGEKVSAWITKPDGTSVDLQTLGYHGVAFSGYNGQNGELYIRITFQDSEGLDDVVTATDFPNGNYTVVAYGNDSKITLSANIDVYR